MDSADTIEFTSLVGVMLEVSAERTTQGAMERLVDGLADRGHIDTAGVWCVVDDGDRPRLRLEVARARDEHGPEHWFHDHGDFRDVPLDEPHLGVVARDGTPHRFGSADRWERPRWAVDHGVRGFHAIRIERDDVVLGVLAVFFGEDVGDAVIEGARWLQLLADQLAVALVNARAYEEVAELQRRLELENVVLREEVERRVFPEIVGRSGALRRVLEQVELVAATDANVLVLGESGTGKELIAQAIHQRSRRSDAALVRVNCATIPRELFESEFFGHVRGAFTGAVRDRAGRFQLADGGTLFLDEIGEIPIELQSKLLRVLQEGTFERIGEEKTRSVDVRVIAATNRDLRAEIEAGRFREDLYYRLSVFPIEIPPLRDRLEDIPDLASHFVARASRRIGVPAPALKRRHLLELQSYGWPGNVRELENAIERAVIIAAGGDLDFSFLPGVESLRPTPEDVAAPPPPLDRILTEDEVRDFERENMRRALDASGWQVQGPDGAASRLGIKPTTLRSRMRSFGLRRDG